VSANEISTLLYSERV
jgi:hypothetical protein